MNSNLPEPSTPKSVHIKTIFRGMLFLGGAKKEGIEFFPSTNDGVLSALAPWLAISFVLNIIFPLIMKEHLVLIQIFFNISVFLFDVCSLLMMLVIVHWYAERWNSEGLWKRTASALLWCRWMPIIDFFILMLIAVALFSSMPSILMSCLAMATIFCFAYIIWLSWFVLKAGLQITTKQSALVVVTIIASTALLLCIFMFFNSHLLLSQMQANMKPA